MIERGNDNKILRSASGEILKQPPIIDISSDYGVTKDGSNLVSAVKNRYAPNVFRSVSGYEPIENGDGFEFTSGSVRGLKGNFFDYSKPFTLEMWVKPTALNSIYLVTIDNNASYSFRPYLAITNTDYFYFYVRIDGVTRSARSGSGVRPDFPVGEWMHILLTYNGVVSCGYNNGYEGTYHYNYSFTTISTDGAVIGGNTRFNGTCSANIKNVKVAPYFLPSYNNFNEDNSTLKISDRQTQVFTPPTYPNTIL